MIITKQYVKQLIKEELTKTEVRDIVDKAIAKQFRHELPKIVKKELVKMLRS